MFQGATVIFQFSLHEILKPLGADGRPIGSYLFQFSLHEILQRNVPFGTSIMYCFQFSLHEILETPILHRPLVNHLPFNSLFMRFAPEAISSWIDLDSFNSLFMRFKMSLIAILATSDADFQFSLHEIPLGSGRPCGRRYSFQFSLHEIQTYKSVIETDWAFESFNSLFMRFVKQTQVKPSPYGAFNSLFMRFARPDGRRVIGPTTIFQFSLHEIPIVLQGGDREGEGGTFNSLFMRFSWDSP